MKSVLVIWCDEETRLLPFNVHEKELEKLKRFHNQFINGNAPDPLAEEMSEYFFATDWKLAFKEDEGPLEHVSYDLVIVTGQLP